jgi:gas vesicle protein
MKDEEGLVQPDATVEDAHSAHGRAGFLAGIVFGAFLGAGIAMLFAPDRGEKTRGRIRRRMRNLGEDAMESIDQAGSRTRKQLSRRKRRLQKELEWLRERAKERAKESRDALD